MRGLTPKSITPPFGNYSHGVWVPAEAGLIRTSGQLPQAIDGSVPNGIEAQARLCFENIRTILAEGGMTEHNIIHLSAWVTDRAHFAGYMLARDAFLAGVATPPASTLLIVSGFTRSEFLVEIAAMAATP